MPRGKRFSGEEKRQILAWYKECLSELEVAKRFKRSRGAVRNFLASTRPKHRKISGQETKKFLAESTGLWFFGSVIKNKVHLI